MVLPRKVVAFERGVRSAERILAIIGGVMLFALMLLGASDVIGRYFLNKPVLGTLEVSQILMAGMVFMGWAYTQKLREHVTVDFVVSRLPPKVRSIMNFITLFLSLVIFSTIVWQSALIAVSTWKSHELIQTINISIAPFQSLVSLGAFILCLELIIQMLQLLYEMRRRG